MYFHSDNVGETAFEIAGKKAEHKARIKFYFIWKKHTQSSKAKNKKEVRQR